MLFKYLQLRRWHVALGMACAVLFMGSAAPSQAQMGPQESGGTLGGSILGGVIGGAIGGRGSRAVVGAVAGAAIGGMIGNRIGAALDAQDRAAVAQATRSAMTSGKSRSYVSKRTGIKARAQVVSSTKTAGRECRTIKQEVVLKDGSVLNDTVRACKGPNGWEV